MDQQGSHGGFGGGDLERILKCQLDLLLCRHKTLFCVKPPLVEAQCINSVDFYKGRHLQVSDQDTAGVNVTKTMKG